jgi:hypothetical protein
MQNDYKLGLTAKTETGGIDQDSEMKQKERKPK